MNNREIDFRRQLFEWLKQDRNADKSNILSMLSDFSKTPEFLNAFKKWQQAKGERYFKQHNARSLKEIFEEMGFYDS